jgi:16S rRNA (guanine527-N7)-methyltransferase
MTNRIGDVIVSRETIERLRIYQEALRTWQSKLNLVSGSTLANFWERHVADSMQLLSIEPEAKIWVDIGSGGGFPGLVIAICGVVDGMTVHLTERDHRKCAFLREVARLTSATNVIVHHGDAEIAIAALQKIDVVTARAVGSLRVLVEIAEDPLRRGAVGLFMKGRDVAAELTELSMDSRFVYSLIPSRTDSSAFIVRVSQRTEID